MRRAGARGDALDRAERQGLITRDATRVTFCHQLARDAVSYSALSGERRRGHDALARAVAGEERLWHRAHAATGPDDAVAGGLDRLGARARRHGAYAAAAHALEQAASLSSACDPRVERLLGAAQCVVWPATSMLRSISWAPRWSGCPCRRCGSSWSTLAAGSRREAETPRAHAVPAHGDRRALRTRRPGQGGPDPRRRRAPVAAGQLARPTQSVSHAAPSASPEGEATASGSSRR